MTTRLYDLSVLSFLQSLGGVGAVLEHGLTHYKTKSINPDDALDTRLIADMHPLRFQLWSVIHHSLGAIEGVKRGTFAPPSPVPEHDYAGFQKKIAETADTLKSYSPAEVNALEGKDVLFVIGERKMPFTAEDFLLSFSLPNLYFHATTTYDILRMQGVPLGKRHYLGHLRLKPAQAAS